MMEELRRAQAVLDVERAKLLDLYGEFHELLESGSVLSEEQQDYLGSLFDRMALQQETYRKQAGVVREHVDRLMANGAYHRSQFNP